MADTVADGQRPSLLVALMPLFFLISLLLLNVIIFGDDALSGSNQIALILSAVLAAIISFKLGYSWENIQQKVVSIIGTAMTSILILLFVGSLAGTWLLSGIIPTMIYYGLAILNPKIFLLAACIVCSIVSIATGSSWSTTATIGVALVAIGKVMGLSEGLIAGAIISGSYFGDKMSPLSDTTNLAPAVAGTDLFTHIRYMMYTTIPSISIAMVLFLIIGLFQNSNGQIADTAIIQQAIDARFNVSLLLLLVPVAVVVMIIKKIPAMPAIFIGALLGGVFAFIFQPELVEDIGKSMGVAESSRGYMMYAGIMKAAYGEISIKTGNAVIDELLTSGGMHGMLGTVWLILAAMIFGGVMEAGGLLKRITDSIMSLVRSTGSLVASTAATCGLINVTASDQYLSIVISGRMYTDVYKEKGLAPQNLSRTLEDTGTVTSVLVPWNTCGAYHANVLNISTLSYLPYCFFNIISPLMTLIFAYAGIKIAKIADKKIKA